MYGNDDVKARLDAAVESALSKLKPGLVDALISCVPEPPPPAPAPAPIELPSALDAPGLRAAAETLFNGTGQVEILNALMGQITAYWSRSVLFLNKGASYQPWDARGFEDGIGNAAAKAAVLPADADTIISAAVLGTGGMHDDGLLIKVFGPPVGHAAAVPLGIRNKAAAVLYCEGPLLPVDAAVAVLELLARVTACAIELSMHTKRTEPFVRTAAVVRGGAAAAPAPAARTATPEFVPAPPEPAPPAPAPAVAPPPPTPAPPPPEPEPEAESGWATPAPAPDPAPAAAAWSAPEPAAAALQPEPEPAPAPPPVAAAAPAREPAAAAPPVSLMQELARPGTKPVVDAGQSFSTEKKFSRWKSVRDQPKGSELVDESLAGVPEAERPKHLEAKKHARLLVTEVKLYNEAKVAVGRKNRDLYERLKEDIERSRQTYNERFGAEFVGRTKYFDDELVATLAEGDASALGR